MIHKNKTGMSMLIFLVAIVAFIVFIHGKIIFSNVLATFSEISSQSNNILRVSEFEMSSNSSRIVILAEECQIDPLESELGPNPRLGWTNPRIPGAPDSEIECIPATPAINYTKDR